MKISLMQEMHIELRWESLDRYELHCIPYLSSENCHRFFASGAKSKRVRR